MADREEMQDLVQVPEIARGVRRHRSDVLRRPRSVTLLNLSPPGSVSKNMSSTPKDRNSPNNETMVPVSSTAPHVLGNSHRDFDKEDGLSAYLHGTTEKRPRERFRSYVESTSGGEDGANRETEMDKNGRNITTYSRRVEGEREKEKRPGDRDERRDYKGDGERRSGGRDEGRDYRREDRRDDRRDGRRDDRYDGKFIRKRDGRDGRDSRDRRSDDRDRNWRPSKYSRDRDSYESDGDHGKYGRDEKKKTERSWKEIAERDRYLKDNRERGRDFPAPPDKKERADRESSYALVDKKDRSDRDKSQYSSEKASTPSETRFPTKLKLKVGGVSRVLHSDGSKGKQETTPSAYEARSGEKSSDKPSERRPDKQPEPAKKRRLRLILQDNSDDDDYDPRPVVPKKDTASPSTPAAKSVQVEETEGIEDRVNRSVVSPSAAEVSTPSVRKSSRIPKKKVLEDFADDIPEESKMDITEDSPPLDDAVGKSRVEDDEDFSKGGDASDRDASVSDDLSDGLEEEEDRPSKAKRRKSQDSLSYPGKSRNAPLTARQRTMQLCKDGDSELRPSLIEFPTGLSHATGGRRGREKLTEEERQVKKAEAARRRKQLVEKTAREIQANAIQKILGQDSSRKKKEERLQKQRQELAQGKKSAALEPAINSIRVTMKAEGTTVSFSQDIDLPQIFTSAPPSYPPPREKCAAPACTNAYRYRDSRSRMPLCSLACYKTIQPPAVMAS